MKNTLTIISTLCLFTLSRSEPPTSYGAPQGGSYGPPKGHEDPYKHELKYIPSKFQMHPLVVRDEQDNFFQIAMMKVMHKKKKKPSKFDFDENYFTNEDLVKFHFLRRNGKHNNKKDKKKIKFEDEKLFFENAKLKSAIFDNFETLELPESNNILDFNQDSSQVAKTDNKEKNDLLNKLNTIKIVADSSKESISETSTDNSLNIEKINQSKENQELEMMTLENDSHIQKRSVHNKHKSNPYLNIKKDEPNPYEFGYKVKDDYSGSKFHQQEASDGNQVRGEYRVELPDGRTQIVTYWADWQTGFHADVKYEGKATYPPNPPKYGPPTGGGNGGYNYPAPSAPGNTYGAP